MVEHLWFGLPSRFLDLCSKDGILGLQVTGVTVSLVESSLRAGQYSFDCATTVRSRNLRFETWAIAGEKPVFDAVRPWICYDGRLEVGTWPIVCTLYAVVLMFIRLQPCLFVVRMLASGA